MFLIAVTGELGHGVTQVFILLLGGGAAIGRPGRLELADYVVPLPASPGRCAIRAATVFTS